MPPRQNTPLLTPDSEAAATHDGEVEADEPMFSGSKNVPRVILYNFIDGASFSVWQAQVLQVLLYHVGGNTTVGWVNGASGAAQVLAALVAGYSADKIAREQTCRVAAFSGLAAIGLTLYGTNTLYTPLFYFSGVLWGTYMGLANPASEALFADSVPSGRRANIYSFKWIVQILCYVVGYIVSMVMFLTMGNHWKNDTMKLVMYAGLGMHPLSMLMLLTIRDKHSLKGPSASLISTTATSKRTLETSSQRFPQTSDEKPPASEDAPASTSEHPSPPAEGEVAGAPSESGWFSDYTYTPYFICFGDFLLACGSGMTLRYIPLFFVNDYSIGPVELMAVFITISVVTAVMAKAALFLASRLGRVRTMLLIRGSGTTLLMYLGVAQGSAADVWPMLTVFVVRNALMNCTLGMSRSMIMDCVAKNNRSKWSAVESFSSFTWSGSALLGGYLADAHGYRFSFIITAGLHYVATAVLVPAYFSSRKLEAETMALNKRKAEDEARRKEQPKLYERTQSINA
jgi:MFS family permease